MVASEPHQYRVYTCSARHIGFGPEHFPCISIWMLVECQLKTTRTYGYPPKPACCWGLVVMEETVGFCRKILCGDFCVLHSNYMNSVHCIIYLFAFIQLLVVIYYFTCTWCWLTLIAFGSVDVLC